MIFWQQFAPIVAAGALAALLLVGFGTIGLPRRGGDARLRPLWLFAGLGGGAFTLYVAHVRFGYYGDALATTYAGAAVLLGGIVGGAMLARGLRGRRVGDHPHCRRCGFDLFGMPPGGVVAPRPPPISHGHRVRTRGTRPARRRRGRRRPSPR